MLNVAPDSVVAAATRWLAHLEPSVPWHNARFGDLDRHQKATAELAVAAFWMYELDWGGQWEIAEWKWPFRADTHFRGCEPWTVLMREVVLRLKGGE